MQQPINTNQLLTTTMTFVIVVVGSSHGFTWAAAAKSFHLSYKKSAKKKRGSVVSASECNCESEKYRFERNTECKSETLGFVGLYWVELSVCIIPPVIYNLLSPWTYPILGNHVNLLVCVLFVICYLLCILDRKQTQVKNTNKQIYVVPQSRARPRRQHIVYYWRNDTNTQLNPV